MIANLCSARMTLVGLERQAFNLGEEGDAMTALPMSLWPTIGARVNRCDEI